MWVSYKNPFVKTKSKEKLEAVFDSEADTLRWHGRDIRLSLL